MLPYSRVARLIAILSLAGCLIAADDASKPPEQPHSQKAKAAVEKHRIAAEKIRAEYYAKLIAADEQFIKDLDASMKLVATSGDGSEIERIAAARKSAQGELQQHREESQGPSYWVWEYANGKHWLKSDGTSVSSDGQRGRWERRGNQIVIRWGNGIDQLTVSEDGMSMTGNNPVMHIKLTGKMIGTNLTGAEPPPE